MLTFLIISMKKTLVFLHGIFVTWSLVQFSSDDISNQFFLSPLTLYFGPHPHPQPLTQKVKNLSLQHTSPFLLMRTQVWGSLLG